MDGGGDVMLLSPCLSSIGGLKLGLLLPVWDASFRGAAIRAPHHTAVAVRHISKDSQVQLQALFCADFETSNYPVVFPVLSWKNHNQHTETVLLALSGVNSIPKCLLLAWTRPPSSRHWAKNTPGKNSTPSASTMA